MRPFLYLSPYFPPDGRVGALRPLKFVRHLPAHGFRPVVLADAPGQTLDLPLEAAVPKEVPVIRDYGRSSRKKLVTHAAARASFSSGTSTRHSRWLSLLERPDLVPLGPQALDIPHALAAAERTFDQYACRAILVNADPFAAALVGALLARRKRAPLLLDFRDPWALCSLRRPLRARWVDATLKKLERFAVETAERVILNTERTRLDYAEHYRDLPGERFVCIPNHADPALTPLPRERAPKASRYRLLFAGTLRRFVEGAPLLDLFAALKQRGVTAREVGLTLAGHVPSDFLYRAAELGLGDFIELLPPVSYLEIPALLDRVDLLVVLSHRDRQRIPAKLYDYALSRRPLLVITENPELELLAERVGGATVFSHEAIERLADYVARQIEAERGDVARSFEWTSASAAHQLALLLDAAMR